jgi:hypothetical protein
MLREAFERCTAAQQAIDANARYEVIKDTESSYMDGSNAIVGTYTTLKEANERAIEHLLFEGYWDSADGEAESGILESGMISSAVETD